MRFGLRRLERKVQMPDFLYRKFDVTIDITTKG